MAMNASIGGRFLLLPEEGTAMAPAGPAASLLGDLPAVRSMSAPESTALDAADGREVTIVDTAREDGPRLVDTDLETAEIVNRSKAPLRMAPEVLYPFPNPPLRAAGGGAMPAAAPVTTQVSCVDAATGDGVEGAHIVAFTDFAQRIGAEGVTDGNGIAELRLPNASVERLYAYPPLAGYWGCFRREVDASSSIDLRMEPIELEFVDGVRHHYAESKFEADRGVQVGVIDTGVGPHGDLNLVGGTNTVTGEPADAFEDPRGHGTHVAGLVGSGGAPPSGLRGLAPSVRLRAYRVFPQSGGGATNYSILKAMIFAAADGCDIVNLSLGGGPFDPIVAEAMVDARVAGMLVVVAAGNDGRAPVSYPAAHAGATAVSAMGRTGTFPAGALAEAHVDPQPQGSDPALFIAGFSNVGPEIALTAPGVGDLSTVPGGEFGAMSGTSMAAPVAAGVAACLLSEDAATFEMPRNLARAEAIEARLLGSCTQLGFGKTFEGKGMPDPAVV